MLQRDHAAPGAMPCALDASLVQFFSVELMRTNDARVAVVIMATLCEREGELESVDFGSHRVDSLEEALVVIRDATAFSF